MNKSSGKQLPAVLRTDVYDVPVGQDINTDLLYPVNISQQGAKFVFPRKGVLDSNSQINISQTCNQIAGAETKCYLPCSTGALAMVRRAWLTIGGRRVSTLDQVGHYNTWKRLHFSNEYREGVAMPKQGGNDVFVGSTGKDMVAAANVNATSVKQRGFLANTPDTGAGNGVLGRIGTEYSKDPATGLQRNTPDKTTGSSDLITSNAATTPNYAIGLSQLIPFLVGVQLPLFAIAEEVALNVEWATDEFGHRFCVPQNQIANQNNITSTIVENDVYIMADYMFFPAQMETLQEEIMEKGGFDIPYDEIQVQETTTAVLTQGSITTEIQLPLGGKVLKSIVVQQEITDGADEGLVNVGRYNSMALRQGQSVNLTIESRPFYANSISNPSLQLSEANAIESGIPLQLCMYRYSFDNQVDAVGDIDKAGITNRTFNGHLSLIEMGSQFWTGVKLENMSGRGIRMSNLPAIFTRRATLDATNPDVGTQHRLRFFCKTARMLNISGGIVNMIE